jgi:hypothetical protein
MPLQHLRELFHAEDFKPNKLRRLSQSMVTEPREDCPISWPCQLQACARSLRGGFGLGPFQRTRDHQGPRLGPNAIAQRA